MPFPQEHSARIKDPGQYDEFRRENDWAGSGIHAIWGIKKGPPRKAELQAIRFDKTKFTVAEAKKWLKDHDYKPILFEPASDERQIAIPRIKTVSQAKPYQPIVKLVRESPLTEDQLREIVKESIDLATGKV